MELPIGVTLPGRTGPIPNVFEYARRAEQAGFYSAGSEFSRPANRQRCQ